MQTSGRGANPERHCLLVVDTAPGESIDGQFDYSGRLTMSRRLACERARAAAEPVMQTLLVQAR